MTLAGSSKLRLRISPRVQSAFDALVHEFEKLAVEQGTDAVFDLASVNRDRRRLTCSARLRGEAALQPPRADTKLLRVFYSYAGCFVLTSLHV